MDIINSIFDSMSKSRVTKPLRSKNKTVVISFVHIKGGTGKSTLCIFLTILLLNQGYKVGVIDLDSSQGTTLNFFQKRKLFNPELLSPHKLIGIQCHNVDSKLESYLTEIEKLQSIINDYTNSDLDFIIIDTPGTGLSNFVKICIWFTDILFTPLNESAIDISMLVEIDKDNHTINYGTFTDLVWNQNQFRKNYKKSPLHWYIIRNRLNPLRTKNSQDCCTILDKISTIANFQLTAPIIDRICYRLKIDGYRTIFDDLDQFNVQKLRMFQEFENIADIVIKYLNN